MCTVTFIPVNKKVTITHSRDEYLSREQALPPAYHKINGHNLLYPKDTRAGGSWVGLNKNGNAAVLLNGGFINHVPTPPYLKSRGIVFLDILAAEDLLQMYRSTSLDNIEPFTIILWNRSRLWECRWDGEDKYIKQLSSAEPHIWASSTLYSNEEIIRKREWLHEWQQKHNMTGLNDIIEFHLHAGEGDAANNLCMNRGSCKTLSITCMEINTDGGKMRYLDLQNDLVHEKEVAFRKSQVEN